MCFSIDRCVTGDLTFCTDTGSNVLEKLTAGEPQAGRHAPSTGARAALKCDEMQ